MTEGNDDKFLTQWFLTTTVFLFWGWLLFFGENYFHLLLIILNINIFGFLFMMVDKYNAKNELSRISNKSFQISSFLGGGFGISLARTIFRHKTLNKRYDPIILQLKSLPIIIISGIFLT